MDEQKKSSKPRSLGRAIRDVRIGDIEQENVVVELGDTERARLELLSEALEDVAKELPEDMESLTFQIVPGRKPRFWVDITSFVEMARDKRHYRFMKDTRLGRVVLNESRDVDDMADSVTHYLAERIVEREKALESDHLLKKMGEGAVTEQAVAVKDGKASVAEVKPAKAGESSGGVWMLLLGILLGVVLAVAFAWYFPTNF